MNACTLIFNPNFHYILRHSGTFLFTSTRSGIDCESFIFTHPPEDEKKKAKRTACGPVACFGRMSPYNNRSSILSCAAKVKTNLCLQLVWIIQYLYPYVEVASSDDVASVEDLAPFGRGLDVQFSFLYVARRCLRKTSLASRKERSYRSVRARVVLVEDPFLRGCARGLYSRTSTIMKTINDGGPRRPDVG